jgi:acyl-CoA thioesterase I
MADSYEIPFDLIRFEHRLERFATGIRRGRASVVAIGSSSTEGAGASSRDWWSYPARLKIELGAKFPPAAIEVLNKGIGGQEAGDELARFKNDVFASDPQLVIWQIGTNAIVKNYDFDEVEFAITRGLTLLRRGNFDVILMDPQYAGQVTDHPEHERIIDFVASAAAAAHVNVFRRFRIMQHWIEHDGVAVEQLINPDRLHQNDWGYLNVTRALARAIEAAR